MCNVFMFEFKTLFVFAWDQLQIPPIQLLHLFLILLLNQEEMEQNYRETVRSNSDRGTTNATVRLLSGVEYDCQLLLSHKTEKDLAVKGYVQLVAEALAAKQDTLQDFLSTMKGLTAAEDKAKLAISNL